MNKRKSTPFAKFSRMRGFGPILSRSANLVALSPERLLHVPDVELQTELASSNEAVFSTPPDAIYSTPSRVNIGLHFTAEDCVSSGLDKNNRPSSAPTAQETSIFQSENFQVHETNSQ